MAKLPNFVEYTPKVIHELPMNLCRLCGGHASVDFYKPQGYMAYCPRCHFVMSTRETTLEKAVEVWNNNN